MTTDATLQAPTYLNNPRQATLLQRLIRLRPELNILCAQSGDRQEVEAYIAQQFTAVYGATIREFMPQLLTLRAEGRLNAVVGIRFAMGRALFLEQYIRSPIEQQLTARLGHTVSRNTVVEIGNLAATHRGSSQLIFLFLTLVLSHSPFHSPLQWVVFTATKQVQAIMARCGFDLHIMGAAQPEKLISNTADWGSYYAGHPIIAAVNIRQALAAIAQNELLVSYFQHYQPAIQCSAEKLVADECLASVAKRAKHASYTDAA